MKKLGHFSDPLLDRQVEEIVQFGEEGWEDMLGAFTAGRAGVLGNPPTYSAYAAHGGATVGAWKFSNVQSQNLDVPFHVLHPYKAESLVFPHIHLSILNGSGASGVIRWKCTFWPMRGYGRQGAILTPVQFNLDYTVNALTGDDHNLIVEASDAQAFNTDLEVDSLILCNVERDITVASNYTGGDVFGLYGDCHFEKDKFATPYRNYPHYDFRES